MSVGRFSGVARVVTHLVDELVRQDGVDVVALCGREVFPQWADRTDFEVVACSFDRGDRTACSRVFWEEKELPRIIRRAGVDLFHATWNSGIPLRCPVPSVLTIHDLIPWREPETHFATVRQRLCYRYAMRSSARRSAFVTTVSEYVRGQVIETLQVPASRVLAVPNGVTVPSSERTEPADGADPYVLYVGGLEPRKNLEAVFATMRCYWDRYDPGLRLLLTGDPGRLSPDADRAYDDLRNDLRIRFLGNPDDAGLDKCYAGAQALLMLSRDEGFGLPVLEAMARGCPVVAADRASLPEVVADAGLLVDPDRTEEAADAIRVLISDPERRAEFIRRGKRHSLAFRWETTASRMRELYEQALVDGRLNGFEPVPPGDTDPRRAVSSGAITNGA